MQSDIEILQRMDLEDQLKFARNKIIELKEQIKVLEQDNHRLTMLLEGKDVMKNSISDALDNK